MGQLKGGTYVGGDLTIANNIVAGGTLTTNNNIYVNGKVFTNGKENTGDQDLSNLATYDYVDNNFLNLTGGTLSGNLSIDTSLFSTATYLVLGQSDFNVVVNKGANSFYPNNTSGLVDLGLSYNRWRYLYTDYLCNSQNTPIHIDTIWHSGNDGAGSGLDAGLLCGRSAELFFKSRVGYLGNINDQSLLVDNSSCYWSPNTTGNPNNGYGVLLNVSDDVSWYNQLGFGTDTHIYFRQSINSTTNFGAWNTVAFTTDNVASATKLQTTRTIWGQNFDGTGNVSGAMTGVSTISASGNITTSGIVYTNGKANTGDQDLGNLSTYSYVDNTFLNLTGGTMTGQLSLLQGAGGGITFPNDSFGGGGDSASIKLLNPAGGESTEMTFTMTNDADDIINFSVPSIDGVKINRYTVWNAGNDGAGSGLDADLLDGMHLKSIIGFDTKRDFINGTLITTDIDYSGTNGEPFYLEIKGNVYGRQYSCLTQAQGYIYADTIVNYGVTHLGYAAIVGLIALNVNGRLCFWFPRQSYWEGYSIFVSSAYSTSYNRVIAIDDVAKPAGTKEVIISEHTSTSAFLDSNVASATKLQTTRTIWGQNFDGTGNVSGDLAMGGATISGTAGKIFFGGNFHIDSYGTYGIYLNHYNNSNVYINAGESQGYTVIGGNVGIGQIDPAYKLNVAGSLKTTGTVYTNVGVKSRNICIETDNDGNISTASSEINNFNSTLFLQQATSNGLAMCAGGGNVSIGTTYNGGYRLYVNGTSAFSSATTFYDDINAQNTINAYKNTPNGTTYSELGIQVYSNDGSPVGIGFHRAGYSQTILEHSGDGLVIRKDGVIGAGGYGNLTANAVTAPIFNGNLNGNASTATKVYAETNGTNSIELVRAVMADNDLFRILVGGTASNSGYVEIATADDGTEPIYVRQYSGVFTSLVRTATLLDEAGNTSFPGVVTGNRFYTGYDSGAANSISCSNWFRSNGNTGWYNDTYGGGITMGDSTYVRISHNKAFKVTSTASDSINTDGGVLAGGTISASGIITGSAIRTTNTSDYSLIVRNSNAPTLFVQNSAAASTQIASFRYGSATAGSGTSVLDINSGSVVSTVGYSKSGSNDSEVLLGGGGTCTRSDVLPIIQGDLSVVNWSYVSSSSVRAYQLGHIVIIQGTFKTGGSASNDTAYFTIPSTIGVPFDDTGWSGVAGNQNTGIKMYIPKGSRTIYLIWNDTGTSTFYQMSWVYYTATSIY